MKFCSPSIIIEKIEKEHNPRAKHSKVVSASYAFSTKQTIYDEDSEEVKNFIRWWKEKVGSDPSNHCQTKVRRGGKH